MRNADLLQSYRAVRTLSVTTTWVARQPSDTILRLAGDLQRCLAGLLRLAGPRHLNLPASQPPSTWNFSDPDSVDLQLWEVPVESGSACEGTMPTVILPTAPVLRFLRRAGQAIVSAMPLRTIPSSTQVQEELDRLKYWVHAVGQLLDDSSSRRSLFGAKFRLLEETKSLQDDSGHDGLLLHFLDQTEAPQTCTYLDAEDPQDEEDEEDITVYSSGESTANNESDSASM